MSHVTQIIISVQAIGNKDLQNVKLFLARFTTEIGCPEFTEIEQVGGNMNLECNLFVGSFNGLDYELFCRCIKQLEMVMEPGDFVTTQIFICNQEDNLWKVVFADQINPNNFDDVYERFP